MALEGETMAEIAGLDVAEVRPPPPAALKGPDLGVFRPALMRGVAWAESMAVLFAKEGGSAKSSSPG